MDEQADTQTGDTPSGTGLNISHNSVCRCVCVRARYQGPIKEGVFFMIDDLGQRTAKVRTNTHTHISTCTALCLMLSLPVHSSTGGEPRESEKANKNRQKKS